MSWSPSWLRGEAPPDYPGASAQQLFKAAGWRRGTAPQGPLSCREPLWGLLILREETPFVC